MINQPFAGQTVWFLFISVGNYSNTDWENYDSAVFFNQTPIGMFSSEKEILRTVESESDKLKKRIEERIKKLLMEGEQIPIEYTKIADSHKIWRRVLDFGNQPQIQFWGVDENGTRYEDHPIGEPPSWMKSKRVTMEIWEYQNYYKNLYDESDVFCFVEVVM